MASALALVQKSLSKGHTWHKNEALDAILYLRVLSAIIAGLTAGILGLEGFYVFAGFVGFNYTSARLWLQYQDLDAEVLASEDGTDTTTGAIYFEGFPPSIAFFVLTWIISYSMVGAGAVA